ncbi:glutamate 5-kinase [Fischerella thermalis]|jgi:glutamate 5-kinase|uniref:Glutamate 5-kinase n=3 Tax=Fischerella TaxID=1190 RepID=G6FNU3_9CYAN|nr:glutamate 5-kinase [Fischerella thermalis]EHC18543.1 Glutamate 5-kinase [Fischerella thermalis JSC-11]MBF1988972.1 glutamate 5-kinase [Fischerella thermalis M58_A2018_009]MBF2062334.1 glutamate 5-kinase [Fischerella thermalis M66_A2018_004]MBF2071848.1 glutamate 5-kinase [Fischerella thermalis M48_A2018_028]PLZ05627.1 glutamate 5-kinase [Fischerella thermalis WC119]
MSKTIVVKIGTSSLTQPETGQLAISTIAILAETLSHLRRQGHQVILVSSGAVGVGCARLGLTERPKAIALKQAVAAVGQGRLIRVYDDLFTTLQQPIAQVLLTRSDLVERSRYLNIYNTFKELLELGVIPVVNENDTVAVEELKFGDNDTLSALVASLVHADWLFLLTDVDRLYSADPRFVPDAQPIALVSSIKELEELQVQTGTQGSQWGTGGMVTKISAARIATAAGVRTVITEGKCPQNIEKILQGEPIGTHFEPHLEPTSARKRWIAYGLVPSGKLYLDEGAVVAISQAGKSLLAAGITALAGEFDAQDAVLLCDSKGNEIARGIVNYSKAELQQICGRHSSEIPVILGYEGAETVVHRDNLVLT